MDDERTEDESVAARSLDPRDRAAWVLGGFRDLVDFVEIEYRHDDVMFSGRTGRVPATLILSRISFAILKTATPSRPETTGGVFFWSIAWMNAWACRRSGSLPGSPGAEPMLSMLRISGAPPSPITSLAIWACRVRKSQEA